MMATQPRTTAAGLAPAASTAVLAVGITVLFSVTSRADGSYGGGFFFQQPSLDTTTVSVVDPDGSIHLERVPSLPSGLINLIFTLNGVSITPGGWVEKITWDPRISGQNGNSGAMNLINARPGVSAMFMPDHAMNIVVSIADKTLLPFSYNPGIVLPSRGSYYISGGAKPVTGPP